jgi:hypothetical protein
MIILGADVHSDRVELEAEEDGRRRTIIVYLRGQPLIQFMEFAADAQDLDMTDEGVGIHQIVRRVLRGAPVNFPLEARFRPEWHPDR